MSRCHITRILEEILRTLREIKHELHPHATQIIMHLGATMPVTLNIGQSVPATAIEKDAAGNSVPFTPSNLSWTSSDPSVSVVTNPDGSATYTAVSAGTSTVTVTDSSNSLTASDTITVNPAPDVATSIEIAFGTPTP